jgi:hypothetical protein
MVGGMAKMGSDFEVLSQSQGPAGWIYMCYPAAQLMDQNVDWFVRQRAGPAGRLPLRGENHMEAGASAPLRPGSVRQIGRRLREPRLSCPGFDGDFETRFSASRKEVPVLCHVRGSIRRS